MFVCFSVCFGVNYFDKNQTLSGRILKRRVRQGVRCFEVEWKNQIKGGLESRTCKVDPSLDRLPCPDDKKRTFLEQ